MSEQLQKKDEVSQKLNDLLYLVEYLAKMLVDFPEQVQVTEKKDKGLILFQLKVAPSDLGKIIGKQGHTVRAIRTLLNGVSTKLKMPVTLEVLES